MKAFITNKKADFWILLVTVLLGIVGVICYATTGTDASEMTDTHMSLLVLLIYIVAVAASVVAMFVEIPLIRTGGAVIYFAALVSWAVNQAGYIVNVFMGIDGNVFSFGYVLAVLVLLVGIVTSIVTGAILLQRIEKKAE
jgi:hypothetical protein